VQGPSTDKHSFKKAAASAHTIRDLSIRQKFSRRETGLLARPQRGIAGTPSERYCWHALREVGSASRKPRTIKATWQRALSHTVDGSHGNICRTHSTNGAESVLNVGFCPGLQHFVRRLHHLIPGKVQTQEQEMRRQARRPQVSKEELCKVPAGVPAGSSVI